MKQVIVRCYRMGEVNEQSAEENLATLRNVLYVAGFRPVFELENDLHCSMRHAQKGIDVTLTIEEE